MEWVVLLLLFTACCSDNKDRVKQLKSKMKRREKRLTKNRNGGKGMSKFISELIGKECMIKTSESLSICSSRLECKVIDADDEWIKVTCIDKKKVSKTLIIRVDLIDNIQLIEKKTLCDA